MILFRILFCSLFGRLVWVGFTYDDRTTYCTYTSTKPKACSTATWMWKIHAASNERRSKGKKVQANLELNYYIWFRMWYTLSNMLASSNLSRTQVTYTKSFLSMKRDFLNFIIYVVEGRHRFIEALSTHLHFDIFLQKGCSNANEWRCKFTRYQ